MYKITDDLSVTNLDNVTFDVTSAEEGMRLSWEYSTSPGINKNFC